MLRTRLLCAALVAPLIIFGGANAAEIAKYVPGKEATTEGGVTIPATRSKLAPFTATELAALAFGGRGAATVVLDFSTSTSSAAQEDTVWIMFPSAVRYQFDLELEVSGAEFTTAIVSASPFVAADTAPGAHTRVVDDLECENFPRGNKVTLTSCGNVEVVATAPQIIGVQLHNLAFTKAVGLGTAGGAIKLTATLIDAADKSAVHVSQAASIYTSVAVVEAKVTPGATLTVCAECDPSFTRLEDGGDGSTTAVLGDVKYTVKSALYPDPAENATGLIAFPVAEAVASSGISVHHTALNDDALSSVSLGPKGGTDPKKRTSIPASSEDEDAVTVKDGAASFSLKLAELDAELDGTHNIMIHFDGKSRISSAGAGRVAVTFVAPATSTYGLPDGATGALASIERGGLNVHLNSVRNSYGNGADQYTSVVRIANNGAVDGSIDLTVFDSATGTMLGQFASPVIPARTTVQWTAAQVEGLLGFTPDKVMLYDVRIEGAITGYVQHLNWNQIEGLFSDLSGFRNGQLTAP